MMRADIDRVEGEREREQHHLVLRTRRKGDHHVGRPERQQRQDEGAESAATATATANEPSAAPR